MADMGLSANSALVVGDTHADVRWLAHVLDRARSLGVEVVVQVGDFGYWDDSRAFLRLAQRARDQYGVDLWFIDGNHEHFGLLATDVALSRLAGQGPREPVALAPGLIYLPRGSRVAIAGLSAVCVGGGVSIDQADRELGVSWFIEERLNDEDIAEAIAGGPADMMLSHDAPAGWVIPGLASNDGSLAPEYRPMIEVSEEHRRRLGDVFTAVRPHYVIHGHYHSAYWRDVDTNWGAVQAIGLGCNGQRFWGVVLRTGDTGLEIDMIETRGWM